MDSLSILGYSFVGCKHANTLLHNKRLKGYYQVELYFDEFGYNLVSGVNTVGLIICSANKKM